MRRSIIRGVDWLAGALLLVGALNWGLIAFTSVDVLAGIGGLSFGETNVVNRFLYALIGLSGLWSILRLVQTRGQAIEALGSGPLKSRRAA